MRVFAFIKKWARARVMNAFWRMDTCPKCGGKLTGGFGLAGGEFGPYKFCDATGCHYFIKRQSED